MVILSDVNFADFTVTSEKFSLANFAFVRRRLIGRIPINLENSIMKILPKLSLAKYKALENCHV